MLDNDSIAFLQSGVSISLASCSPGGMPVMSRGMGCKIIDGGRQIAVFIKPSQAAELLDAIRSTGRVANVFSLPSTNRTLQLKGIDARVTPFDPADLAVVEAHVADFIAEVVPLGLPEAVVRTVFSLVPEDLATVIYTPSAAFSQTPGPKAGEALGAAR